MYVSNHKNRILVHLGNSSCRIAETVWPQICRQHNIGFDGLRNTPGADSAQNIQFYFDETVGGRWKPRVLLFHAGQNKMSSQLQSLLRENAFVCSSKYSSQGFFEGLYIEQNKYQLAERLDILRSMIQGQDYTPIVEIHHPTTRHSAGVAAFMANNLIDEGIKSHSYSMLCSRYIDWREVYPYDETMCLQYLLDNVEACYLLDGDILNREIAVSQSSDYKNINKLFGKTIVQSSMCSRFGYSATSRYNVEELIPSPRLKFFTLFQASGRSPQNSAADVAARLFEQDSCLMSVDCRQGTILASHTHIQGMVLQQQDDVRVREIQSRYSYRYGSEDNNTNFYVGTAEKSIEGIVVCNWTGLTERFKIIQEAFVKRYRRKAYLFHYAGGCGADEMELTEAEQNLIDIIKQYEQQEVSYEPSEQQQAGRN